MNIELQSLKGWLKVYFIYLLVAVALSAISMVQGALQDFGNYWNSMHVVRFGLFTFAAYAVTQVGKPWVRNMHIALNGVSAIVALASAAGFSTILGWLVLSPLSGLIYLVRPLGQMELFYSIISPGNVVLPFAWAVYWVMSERIKKTYVEPDGPQQADSPSAEPAGYQFEGDKTPARTADTPGKGGEAATSSGSSRRGLLKGCLISLILLVTGILILFASLGEDELFAMAFLAILYLFGVSQ